MGLWMNNLSSKQRRGSKRPVRVPNPAPKSLGIKARPMLEALLLSRADDTKLDAARALADKEAALIKDDTAFVAAMRESLKNGVGSVPVPLVLNDDTRAVFASELARLESKP